MSADKEAGQQGTDEAGKKPCLLKHCLLGAAHDVGTLRRGN